MTEPGELNNGNTNILKSATCKMSEHHGMHKISDQTIDPCPSHAHPRQRAILAAGFARNKWQNYPTNTAPTTEGNSN